jgi:hypothetical protein
LEEAVPDTPVLLSPQEFVSAWSDYLEALQQAVQARLDRLDDANFLTAFRELYTDAFQLLQSTELQRSLEIAITAALDEADGPEAVEFLMREILAYTRWQRPSAAPADNTRVARRRPVEASVDAESGPDAVGAGQTIKESLENFLKGKISGRFSKALKVLNELLSIVRG